MRDFPCHVLRANHSKEYPHRMVFLDCEAWVEDLGYQEVHTFRLAWTCYVRRRGKGKKDEEHWRLWRNSEDLWTYIESLIHSKTILYLFAHNAFYDLQVSGFFKYFTRWGWRLEFVYEAQDTFILTCRKGKRRLRILSTTNYFPVSVRELGSILGLEKMEVDPKEASEDELIPYCKRDVEIIKRAIEYYISFIQEHDLGKFSFSRAGQAWSAYRHRFMNRKIYVHHDKDVQDLEIRAYAGGRVECFRVGEMPPGEYVHLDINSLYPYIMREVPLPVKLIDYFEGIEPERALGILGKYLAVAEVHVSTPEPLFTLKEGQKVIYPVGDFRCFSTTPVLLQGLSLGYIKHIYRMAVYEGDYIFRDYVDYFYNLRMKYRSESNRIMEAFCKYMLNSLYGKFGQYKPVIEREDRPDAEGYWRLESIDTVTGEREIEYILLNTYIRQKGREPAENSFFAIVAHITEWGRFILYQIIRDVGRDRVYYCDTDSIIIKKEDISRVRYPIDPKRLGALKLVDTYRELALYGPKLYRTEKFRKYKAIPYDAEEIEHMVFQFYNWPKLRTHMRIGVIDKYVRELSTRELESRYDKGIVLDDGRVEPFRFREKLVA